MSFENISVSPRETAAGGFLAGMALAILAYKGFTTITNSGEEIVDPHRNVGRAIVISISVCLALYLLVTLAIGGTLSIDEIIAARDYALAEAARPAFGHCGLRAAQPTAAPSVRTMSPASPKWSNGHRFV